MKTLRFVIIFYFSLTVFAGCGKTGSSLKSNTNLSCDTADCVGGDNTLISKAQKTDGIISQRQLLPNFKSCLGVPDSAVSQATKDAYTESISSLSQDGLVKDLSAPMMMAIAKVTSELCQDLAVNVEKNSAQRKYFAGFTLGGTTDTAQTYDLNKTLIALSNSCWGRTISESELNIMKSKLSAGAKDKATAIFVCTAILSSAAAVRF